jgi:hypothetical protein
VSYGGKRGWPALQVVTIGLGGTIIAQSAILMISASWAWLLWIALALFVTVMTLVQTRVSLFFPSSLAGRANSGYNLMLFSGAFAVQWGIGVLIDLFEKHGTSPAHAMKYVRCIRIQNHLARQVVLWFYRSQLNRRGLHVNYF